MNVVIYESSSRGGNYRYAFSLFHAFKAEPRVKRVTLLIPRSSEFVAEPGIEPLLPSDQMSGNNVVNRIRFLIKTLVAPFVLFSRLLRAPRCLVIFNDFEQLSAPLWSWAFRVFLPKHRYAVVLHDPDRDAYPPSVSFARYTMGKVMKMMDLGLYHEHLPEKPYYKHPKTKFVNVPHGIYALPEQDRVLSNTLKEFKDGATVFAVVGNIRQEKNYELAIHALKHLPTARLVVAGSPASLDFSVERLQILAKERGVSDRVLWIVRYLSESELAAVITEADCILLNYSISFASQSGILNMVAPFKKQLIVSDTASGLSSLVKRYNLGLMITPDSAPALQEAMRKIIHHSTSSSGERWDSFIQYASWGNHIKTLLNAYDGV